jgi:hypothetical protein
MYTSEFVTWKTFCFFRVNRFSGNWFLNRRFRNSNLNRHNFFPPILIEMYFFLVIIGLYVATNKQKCENNKIFVRHISDTKYFSKISMFCLRKTGNFKAMLRVNWLTWEKTKSFPCHKFTCIHDTKNCLLISLMAFELLGWQGWVPLKKKLPYENFSGPLKLF